MCLTSAYKNCYFNNYRSTFVATISIFIAQEQLIQFCFVASFLLDIHTS